MKAAGLSRLRVYLLLFFAESVALMLFSFVPSATMPVGKGFLLRPGDIEHFIAYLVYGFLCARLAVHFLSPARKGPVVEILIPIAAGALLGGICEAIQFFVPLRTADMLDWAADTLGALAGAFMAMRFRGLFKI